MNRYIPIFVLLTVFSCNENKSQTCSELDLSSVNSLPWNGSISIPKSWVLVDSTRLGSTTLVYSRIYMDSDSANYAWITCDDLSRFYKTAVPFEDIVKETDAKIKAFKNGNVELLKNQLIKVDEFQASILMYKVTKSNHQVYITNVSFFVEGGKQIDIILQAKSVERRNAKEILDCILRSLIIKSRPLI